MLLFAEEAHEAPLIVQFINHYLGEPFYNFEMNVTKPLWDKFLGFFGSSAEGQFGPYTPENAIPWYTIMFVIACILTVIIISMLKGKLSEDDPGHGQLTLEAGFLAIKDLVISVIGIHGFQYFPVVATFAVLILVSNLMGQFPLFLPPTGSVNVTYALALTSFIYYNYVGIHENGLLKHLAHFAGPRLPLIMAILITPLIFGIEVISNMIRPFTLGVRLFANMFADEQLASQVAGLAPPYTQFLIPVVLLPLAFFVAFVQTLVFTLLSMIYISEVSHPHEHDDHSVEHVEAAPAHA
jgi:F-type H+-transporting ATPase subunit a